MVRVVMDIFINQNASKLFIDFLLCVLLKSGTRGFFVLARVCSYCAGVNNVIYLARASAHVTHPAQSVISQEIRGGECSLGLSRFPLFLNYFLVFSLLHNLPGILPGGIMSVCF